MHKLKLKFSLLLVLLLNSNVYSQCINCNPTEIAVVPRIGTVNNPTQYTQKSGSSIRNQIIRFNTIGYYNWLTNNTITTLGVVVDSDVNLNMGSNNTVGNVETFIIEGLSPTNRGCITVKSGGVLTFSWISEFKYVDICVEEGGTIIFDSKNGGDGSRNTYTFNDVTISLQGQNANLQFGDSFINIEGNLDIFGWTGDESCPTPTSKNPASNQSGNIYWNDETENICVILNTKVLPVEWLNFGVYFDKNTNTNIVKWNTLTERNSSHFIIQRSIGGISTFEDMGSVSAIGYSDIKTNYEFTDSDLPNYSTNLYYRIKQFDFDGSVSYSPVILNKFSPKSIDRNWIVYPNPIVGSDINIQLSNRNFYSGGDIVLNVHSNQTDTKMVTNIDRINYDLKSLIGKSSNGLIVLRIEYNNTVEIIKLLKK